MSDEKLPGVADLESVMGASARAERARVEGQVMESYDRLLAECDRLRAENERLLAVMVDVTKRLDKVYERLMTGQTVPLKDPKAPPTIPFRPYCSYSTESDALVVYLSREADCSEQVTPQLTVYRSLDTKAVIGVRVDGVTKLMSDGTTPCKEPQAERTIPFRDVRVGQRFRFGNHCYRRIGAGGGSMALTEDYGVTNFLDHNQSCTPLPDDPLVEKMPLGPDWTRDELEKRMVTMKKAHADEVANLCKKLERAEGNLRRLIDWCIGTENEANHES